ncbi:YopX family protein [Bacillus pseudomycoides]|uniref:YopX family protein n=1 Tax=Bacillus pseudomycoides TaxID=64104 RepID=UPI000BEB7A2F|nr:YopX family protein [Bacillus pseudomycoides]PEE42855.1 hypothetical protein COO02_05720 [Bacillus pseudomycoides]
MSREIKFRAWDEELKKMYSGDEIECEDNLDAWLSYGELAIYRMDNGEYTQLKPLQYTGLNDKNDNPIYEGDIVHVWEQDSFIPNRDSGGGIIDYDCKDGFSQLGVVSFKGAWYTYETKQHLEGREEQIYAPLDFTNDLFVVGNIYENADLIQGGRTMKYTEHGTYEVTQLLAETKETERNGN